MPYEQLTLPFTYIDEEDMNRVSSEAKGFLYDTADDIGLKKRTVLKASWDNAVDPTEITAIFPARKKPYHTTYSRETTEFYSRFFKDFTDTVQQYSPTSNTPSKNKNRWVPPRPSGVVVEYGNAHMPRFFRVKANENKTITCDYGFAVVERSLVNRSSLTSKEEIRFWIHTEYEFSEKEERHIVKEDSSWVAVYQANICGDIFIKSFNNYPAYISCKAIVYPWLAFSLFDQANSQAYKNFNNVTTTFLKNNIAVKLFDRSQNYAVESLLERSPAQNMLKTFVAEAVTSFDFKDFVKKIASSHLADDTNLYPMFYKFVSQCFQDVDLGKVNSESFSNLIGLLAKVVHYYEDPSILEHLPNTLVDVTISSVGLRTYYGATGERSVKIDSSTIEMLLNDPLFASFNRAKQYRIFGSMFSSEGHYRDAQDLLPMLNAIKAKGESTLEKIASRRVKDIHSFHEEAVGVYNSLRYKAIPIDKKQVSFLEEYGCDILDTNLTIITPEDTNVIRTWGTLQAHCIGSYADRMASNNTLLLGVKDKLTDEWVGHFQIATYNQFMGALNTAISNGTALQSARLYPHTTSSEEKLVNKVVKDKLKENDGIVDNLLTYQYTYAQITQFYGKRNSPVAEDIKRATTDHITKALISSYKNLYIETNIEKEMAIV